jgi:hypothetical protein
VFLPLFLRVSDRNAFLTSSHGFYMRFSTSHSYLITIRTVGDTSILWSFTLYDFLQLPVSHFFFGPNIRLQLFSNLVSLCCTIRRIQNYGLDISKSHLVIPISRGFIWIFYSFNSLTTERSDYDRCFLQITVRKPVILTEILRGFPQSFPNKLRSLPSRPCQLFMLISSDYSLLHILTYWTFI